MAYETLEVALRPYELSERLAGVLRSRCETDCDLWTFEMLRQPLLRDWATAEAATADMIVIAARGDAELPEHVKTWIESWLPQRKHGLTNLVGILGAEVETSGAAPRFCAYLNQAAQKGQMRFCRKADRWWQSDVEHKDGIIPRPTKDALRGLADALHLLPASC